MLGGAAWVAAAGSAAENRRSAADARLYFNGAKGAVLRAGSAFYAGVLDRDEGFAILHSKDFSRADIQAEAAANTFRGVQLQRHDIFQI